MPGRCPESRVRRRGGRPLLDHDHERCVADALAAAIDLCERRGNRLTPVRRRVLELVWRSHEPVGAYALLELLRDDGWSAAPPTVYRALDFLLENGLIHRIESRNAFVGCNDPRHPHQSQHLICRQCGAVTELAADAVLGALHASAAAVGFTVERQTIEVSGICRACAGDRADRQAG
jgi:Fur family zinc uptake transcriptional regulator